MEDKTNCILFFTSKRLPKLNISYENRNIKQYRTVEYLRWHLDSNIAAKS